MKYLKFFEELNKECIKKEIDIIYRDSKLVCLIPKTQRTSYIYGYKTNWCSREIDTFDEIADDGDKILFRFLFKDGYKMRLTYDLRTKKMDWSDYSSKHYFEKNSDNPFFISEKEIKDEMWNRGNSGAPKVEKFLKYFNDIPNSCREKIMDIISNEKRVDYKFSPIAYIKHKKL